MSCSPHQHGLRIVRKTITWIEIVVLYQNTKRSAKLEQNHWGSFLLTSTALFSYQAGSPGQHGSSKAPKQADPGSAACEPTRFSPTLLRYFIRRNLGRHCNSANHSRNDRAHRTTVTLSAGHFYTYVLGENQQNTEGKAHNMNSMPCVVGA